MRLTTCCRISMAVIMLGMCSTSGSRVEWPIGRGGNCHFYEAVAVRGAISWATAILVGLGAARVLSVATLSNRQS